MEVNGHENKLKKHKKGNECKANAEVYCKDSGGFSSPRIKAIEQLSGFIGSLYCTKVADNKQEAGFSLQD